VQSGERGRVEREGGDGRGAPAAGERLGHAGPPWSSSRRGTLPDGRAAAAWLATAWRRRGSTREDFFVLGPRTRGSGRSLA
jgi:hypothetical protein